MDKKTLNGNMLLGREILRTKSDSASCAQNAISCVLNNARESIRMDLIGRTVNDAVLSDVDKCVLLLMLEHGLRISECLSINSKSILGNRRLLVHGSKGSEDRLLENVSYYSSLMSLLGGTPPNAFFPSRFYYYRLCVKLGIRYESSLSSKVSVTHAGRHLYIAGLRDSNVSTEQIGHHIGHKRTRSTNFYI
jgi:integrase